MAYHIGQIRYAGSGLTDVAASAALVGDSSGNGFRDVAVTAATSMSKDYYLHLSVPRDVSYDMTVNVNLTDGKTRQFLRQLTIKSGGGGIASHDVALYETTGGNVDVTMPLAYDPGAKPVDGALYKSDDGRFYLGTASGYEQTTKVNYMLMSESWRHTSSDENATFDIAFRPVANFTSITLDMVRISEDYSIRNQGSDGAQFFGRYIDVNGMAVHLCEVEDVVKRIGSDVELERIGVWSHPELMLIVNGQEIKVGQSGYYEQDVLPVRTLGVVADGPRDSWTLDYTYKDREEGDE